MAYLQAFANIFGRARFYFSKLLVFLDRKALYAWYVFFFCVAFFSILYLTIDGVFSLDDHFFHIRFAQLFWQEGTSAFTNFQSIYFSRMGIGHEYFVYYNFLFYVALIPFTFITPLVVGIKMYSIIALSLSFTTVYLFFRNTYVKYPFLGTIFFMMVLMQSGWITRLSLARPFTMAPVFLVAILYCVYRKKYWATMLMSFLYFYWHTATLLFPFCIAFGYFIFEQFYGKKPDWKIIIMPLTGTVLAVFTAYLISPGVISYLRDVIFPVFFDTTFTKSTGIAEGAEVYGKDFFSILSSFFWFLFFLVILGYYEILRYIKYKKESLEAEDNIDMSIQPLRATLFMASLVFWSGSFLSSRFLDYFVYFCALYVAIAVTDAIKFIHIRGVMFKKALGGGVLIMSILLFANLSLISYEALGKSGQYTTAQGAAEWLNKNLENNKIIFNVDWDSFPTLYYFTGDRYRYVTGLEPRFLYDLDHKLYWKWFNIGNGIYCTKSDCSELLAQQNNAVNSREENKRIWYEKQGNLMADAILTDFKTDIVVLSINRKKLLEIMDHSNRFKKEFFDDSNSVYAVYRVVNENENEKVR